MSLFEFLLARIAEDAALASRATGAKPTGNWWVEPDEGGVSDVSCLDVTGFVTAVDVDAAHIARHDPARVLAECEAKRRIMEYLGMLMESWGLVRLHESDKAAYPDVTRREKSTAHSMLCALAAVYADHPDYDQEWSL